MSPANKEPLVDIGANLTNSAFKDDLDEVIDRAQTANVAKIIITGTDLASSEQAVSLAQQHPGKLFSTAGIHPHDAKHYSPEAHSELLSLAQLPQVKAIGETINVSSREQ